MIADRACGRNVIGPRMQGLKRNHFGREGIALHTGEREQGCNDRGFLGDPAKRAAFYDDLNGLLAELDCKVVVCVFEKPRFFEEYTNPADLCHSGGGVAKRHYTDSA